MISVVKGPISPKPVSLSAAEKAISLSVIEKHKQYCYILLFYTENVLTSFKHPVLPLFSFLSSSTRLSVRFEMSVNE